MKPEAILFDAGGTLVLQDPAALSEVLGHPIEFDTLFEAHYRAMDAYARRRAAGEELGWIWWQDLFFRGVGLSEPRRGAELTNNGFGFWNRAIEHTAEAVRELSAMGVRVAVVSNSDGSVRESLIRAGFAGLFEFVVDSHEVGLAKPDPGIFHHALARMGVAPDRTWYVGDSLFHDIGGAAAAGLAAGILVDPLNLAPEQRPRVGSVRDLPAMVGRRRSAP
ncbi:MAG TPA: HAD family hydrolase [Acidimicrobiia bacterium]|nr:HAD family hydrolase [Acidimicrobiia bacterium]